MEDGWHPGFYITEHYRNYPAVLVRLSKVEREELRDLLERAGAARRRSGCLQEHDAKG